MRVRVRVRVSVRSKGEQEGVCLISDAVRSAAAGEVWRSVFQPRARLVAAVGSNRVYIR